MRLIHTWIWVGIIHLGIAVSVAEAYPVFRRYYEAEFGNKVRCELCHAHGGGTDRNPYGRAWRDAGEDIAAFRKLSKLDSDGDKVSNGEELERGSNPGDRRSTPDKPGRYWTQTQSVPIPIEQIQLVVGEVNTVDAAEPILTEAQARTILKGTGAKTLSPDAKYPTIFLGVAGSNVRYLATFRHFRVDDQFFSVLLGIDRWGKVHKIALFRSGDEEGSYYMPYVNCMRGSTKDTLPKPGEGKCPKLRPDLKAGGLAIHAAVHNALWTVQALFGKSD